MPERYERGLRGWRLLSRLSYHIQDAKHVVQVRVLRSHHVVKHSESMVGSEASTVLSSYQLLIGIAFWGWKR